MRVGDYCLSFIHHSLTFSPLLSIAFLYLQITSTQIHSKSNRHVTAGKTMSIVRKGGREPKGSSVLFIPFLALRSPYHPCTLSVYSSFPFVLS